jgi:heme-degrading monooxygenase HmoA
MIYEIAQIEVTPGQEQAFEAAVAEAAGYFKSAPGCRSLALHRVVERPSSYHLVVGWDTVEDHTIRFRGSENFQHWRRLAGPHFASPPVAEHVTIALQAF